MQTQDLDRETAALFAAADSALNAGDFRRRRPPAVGSRPRQHRRPSPIPRLALRHAGRPQAGDIQAGQGPLRKGVLPQREHFVHFITADVLRQHAEEYDLLEDTEFEWTDLEDFRMSEGTIEDFVKLLRKQIYEDGVTA